MNDQKNTPTGGRNDRSLVLRVDPRRISPQTNKPLVRPGPNTDALSRKPVLADLRTPTDWTEDPSKVHRLDRGHLEDVLKPQREGVYFGRPENFAGFVIIPKDIPMQYKALPDGKFQVEIGHQGIPLFDLWKAEEPFSASNGITGGLGWINQLQAIPSLAVPKAFVQRLDFEPTRALTLPSAPGQPIDAVAEWHVELRASLMQMLLQQRSDPNKMLGGDELLLGANTLMWISLMQDGPRLIFDSVHSTYQAACRFAQDVDHRDLGLMGKPKNDWPMVDELRTMPHRLFPMLENVYQNQN